MKRMTPDQAVSALQAYIAGAGGHEFQIVNQALGVIEETVERYLADGDAAENAAADTVDDAGGMARILAEIRRKYDPLLDALAPFLELFQSVEGKDLDAELLLDHRDENGRAISLPVNALFRLANAVAALDGGDDPNETGEGAPA